MKKLLLLLPLVFLPAPVMAQQVNQFGVCTQYQEVYVPGGYDQYGNYYPGGVQTQSYNVPCNQVSGGNWNSNQYNNGYYGGQYRGRALAYNSTRRGATYANSGISNINRRSSVNGSNTL